MTLLLAGALLAVLVLAVSLGSVQVPLAETLRVVTGRGATDPRWDVIVTEFRIPRAVTAMLAGAALGVAGLQMQTLFRNALADPYILGISSGASLGVALVTLAGGAAAGGFTGSLAGMGRVGVVLAASGGAALVLGLILFLARWVRNAVTLLLVGVMLGAGTSAIVAIMVVSADPRAIQQYLLWGMGSFAGTTWSDLQLLAPVIAGALLVVGGTLRSLNALLMGERYARTMGIDLRRARRATLLSAAVLAGSVTAFCGPIGFLGLAVPHLTRLAFRTADHRVLLPGVCLVGALVALGCGIVAQLPGTETTLPLNAVTALVGAPVVVLVLVRARSGALGGMA